MSQTKFHLLLSKDWTSGAVVVSLSKRPPRDPMGLLIEVTLDVPDEAFYRKMQITIPKDAGEIKVSPVVIKSLLKEPT